MDGLRLGENKIGVRLGIDWGWAGDRLGLGWGWTEDRLGLNWG